MTDQLIVNWDELYAGDSIPPWEELRPHEGFCQFVSSYLSDGDTVLELGSGLGHDAIHLAGKGIAVTASDISPNAVNRIKKLADNRNVDLNCHVLDITSNQDWAKPYDAVFDKGCFHSFFNLKARKRFVTSVSKAIKASGLWLTSVGSADNQDDPADPFLRTYPRLTLKEICDVVEPDFEILEVKKGWYGFSGERRFVTWECAFRKRMPT